MDGEVVFYSKEQLDALDRRELPEDTTSPLGQIYARWNEANRRAIREYDKSIAATERYERRRGFYGDNQAGTSA